MSVLTTAKTAKPLAAHVAEFVTTTRYSDIPAETVRIAKKHILDTLATGLAGAPAEGSAIVRRYVEQLGCAGTATVFGMALRAQPRFAALANATAMHADDYDDTYHPTRFHPSAPVLAAVCAEGEAAGVSGKDVIAAFSVGTEVSVKLSHTIDRQHYLRGFHMTSTCGVFGATAGVCHVRRLSPAATLAAIGIAGSESAGVRENFGTMVKPLHSGRAAENAVFAAALAGMEFTSAPTILEGPRGYFMTGAGGYNAEELTGKLGNPWNYVSQRVAIKPYPCGNLQQPAMDALRDLVLAHDIKPEQVERLAVKSHRLMPLNLTYHRPTTGLEGKFSMEFSLAAILVLRRAGLSEYSDAVVNRPDVQEAIGKIDYSVYSDDEAHAKGYTLLTTFLDITLKDGRTFSTRAEAARGSASLPMTEDEVAAKFRDCAQFARWPADRTEKIIALVLELEKTNDVRVLTALLHADS
ncbi:MAG TPA: MmgE/PrpD family protein [Burkholderiales bacterium]|jgi:2-methylcitrate dehydratase PrpD|nr:MmgE/PrpD family protein [Burkholderiales bacterium]